MHLQWFRGVIQSMSAIAAMIVSEQNYAIPPQLIYDTAPDYLVTMEAFVRLGLEQETEFHDRYSLAREIPTSFYGTGMRLYEAVR